MKGDAQPAGDSWKVSGMEETFATQSEAEQAGRMLAKEKQCEFILHGEDGTIRERDSYGNDLRNILLSPVTAQRTVSGKTHSSYRQWQRADSDVFEYLMAVSYTHLTLPTKRIV